jgi:fido (protein-threonine AMPylation protein)
MEIYPLKSDSISGELDKDLFVEYEKFYGLTMPKPPSEANIHYLTTSKLIQLHEMAMRNSENDDIIGKIRNRTVWAYNHFHPIVHAPPEHLEDLLTSLCSWVNNWWPSVANMSSTKRREFALSLIPRIVILHPFMDGNKRASRLLANAVLYRMDLPTFEWDFEDIELRSSYQLDFANLLMSGNLPGCVALHQRVRKYELFKQSVRNKTYYESVGMVLFKEKG